MKTISYLNHYKLVNLFYIFFGIFLACSPLLTKKNPVKSFNYAIDLEPIFNESIAIKDEGKKSFDDSFTSTMLIDKMAFGWSLANTLDACRNEGEQNEGLSSEVHWRQPFTTIEIIREVKRKGFNSIRIPVTWHNHLLDSSFTIDPEWMTRVKEVIDMCINEGFYVILNTQHDNFGSYSDEIPYGYYYPNKKNKIESEKYVLNIWKQIALAFNNGYDHHLIFEIFNEIRLVGTEYEWSYKKGEPICEEEVSCINEFIRLGVQAIRESGGNNEKRFILVTNLGASPENMINADFVIPSDIKYNPDNSKILISAHMYSPFDFAFNPDMKYTTFTDEDKISLETTFKKLYETFSLHGHDVIITEMGAVNKNNLEERLKWGKFFIETARKYHLASIIWDNGYTDCSEGSSEVLGNFHRAELKWEWDILVDEFVKSGKITFIDNPEESYEKNITTLPVDLDNEWKTKLYLDYNVFYGYNSFCKLIFTETDPPFTAEYPSLKFDYADWTGHYYFNSTDIEGTTLEDGYLMRFTTGTNKVEVFLNTNNAEIAKIHGIVFNGGGFTITELYITGPRFIKMEPMQLIRSSKIQKVNIYFNEDASSLSGNIIFKNFYYDINNQIKCKINKNNNQIIVCEGVFNFTGEYNIYDSNDYSLAGRILKVIPEKGGEYNIKNLIENKVLFDEPLDEVSIYLSQKLFSEISDKSILTIETDELFFEPAFKEFTIYKGNSNDIFKVDSKNINVTQFNNGSLIIPSGRELIKINLKDDYKILKEKGITIKGYGFSIKTIFLNGEKIKNNSGIKWWGVLLIIIVCSIVLAACYFIFRHFRKINNIEDDLNKSLPGNQKQKLLN